MKVSALVLLTGIACVAILFTVLDRGLSGGSATNPAYAFGVVLVCLIAAVTILRGNDGVANFVGKAAAVAPVLLLGYCGYASWKWDHRPEQLERGKLADNIRCATAKAGVPDSLRKLVKVRIGLIAQYGDAGGGAQREIEERLRIHIHPDCQFARY